MAKINELREKRAKIWEQAKAFLDSHRNETGILSAEDTAAYEKMEKDIVDLGHEIERQQRADDLERELNLPTSTPLVSKPDNVNRESKTGTASEKYNKAFWNQMRNRSTQEVRNILSEGVDSEGGFLVPETFENTLVQALDEELVIRQLAHTFTTASNAHKIPVVATRGKAMWTEENAAITDSDTSFGQKTIGAHKLCALIKVSEELLNDSAFDLESYFNQEFARRIGEAEEEAFVIGDGSSKPYGIFNDTEGGEVGVTAGSTVNVTADEIIDLYYSLKAPYRKNGVWLLNDSTVNIIRKLKDSNGQYLWQPSIKDGETDTLLGKPVYTSSSIASAASGTKPIAFGDLSYYWIGDRQGVTFKRLNELYAANGQVGFLATKRVDARLIVPEAVKILKMKGTVSSGG